MRIVTSDYESADEANIDHSGVIVDEAVTLSNVVKALFYPRATYPRYDAVYCSTALDLAREIMVIWDQIRFAPVRFDTLYP